MSFNNILLDSITTPFETTITSRSPKVIQQNKNISDNSVSSKNDKSHIAKIESYISKKYDEVGLQNLKRELLKEINNEGHWTKLRSKVTEINNLTGELNKVTHIAIPKNVINQNNESNSSPTIENITH